ncbi:hypothetical protein VTO42DRAFT_1065 [Malbranchea cinnamomea]
MAPSPYSSSESIAHSPDAGGDDAGGSPLPGLDTLVSHLVAAKRSLSSINHVWRANEIVTTARAALEESVVLSARTGFLRRGLDDQLQLLYNVREEVEQVELRGRDEFTAALQELDSVDDHLKQTLEILRETTVEPAFRPPNEPLKSLHDFVDETAVEEIQSLLKDAIDKTNTAHANLEESNNAFDNDLRSIQKALRKYNKKIQTSSQSQSYPSPSASAVNVPSPSLFPELLQSLESHAQEMANLLQSLVRHYDLCVTAVKHTEGGGAAATRVAGDLPTGVNVGSNTQVTEQGEDLHPLEPLTEEEYREMIAVVTKDAPEANEVVHEIQERISEMETTLEQVLEQRDALAAACASTTEIFHRLAHFASRKLPGYIAQTHVFTGIWREQHDRIQSGMADLTELRSMYTGFLDAYDGLILEAARRRSVRMAVEKVLRDARAKLDKLYEEDLKARETFRVEQGDYLPNDIWPGLGKGPVKIEFKRVSDNGHPKEEGDNAAAGGNEGEKEASGQNEDYYAVDGGESLPELPRQVVERALERVKMRGRALRIPRQ